MTDAPPVIDGHPIGAGHPPWIVAEMSGNHNGDIVRARELIAAAKEAGADAVKLQTYTADTLTIDHDSADFRITSGLWAGHTLHQLYRSAHTPWEWHHELFDLGRKLGLAVFSSPFDETAVDFLETLQAPAYKIASFEANDPALIAKAASTGKPLIISTGMANLEEIGNAVAWAQRAGCAQPILLHCVSGYPTPIAQSNLRTLPDLHRRLGLPIGLSDHTTGISVAVAAVALGACLIEKHFTLSRSDGGPDAAFSLEPAELASLAKSCLEAWQALGEVSYERSPAEADSVIFRRSLYVVEAIGKGQKFTSRNVRSIRPGYGLPPADLPGVLGRRARCDIARGTALSWDLIADSAEP